MNLNMRGETSPPLPRLESETVRNQKKTSLKTEKLFYQSEKHATPLDMKLKSEKYSRNWKLYFRNQKIAI